MHHISSNDTDCDDISEPSVTVDMGAFPPRYRDVSLIGCGSRSLIFSVIDQMDQTNLRRIAVKKVAIQGEKKDPIFRQLLREIRILNRLDHQNIVKIHHVLVSTANDYLDNPMNVGGGLHEIDCLYLGMELMDTNLRNILEKHPLDADYIKLFMYQILRGTKYLHSANVIHRDLTPSNILVNMDTLMLKIGDFGVSRLLDVEYDHTYHLSLPLTTKYYQAPELLLHPHHYTKGMDLWSIGCIFLEMLTGSIAFPGENAYEQMSLILETIPVTENDWQLAASAGCMDENCCPCSSNYSVQENGGCPVNPLENFLFDVDSSGINLLKQMLLFDSAMRIDADDSIAHPYFISYSNPNDEPACARPFHIEDEIDECCAGDVQAMLQDLSDSVTSSFSRSTDTASHMGQYDRMDELNLMGLSSGNSIVANGSYRHLLSLAENTQGDALSESEVRNIAVDLDYGVQIHECSLNKDRMSIDIRPASTTAACFDPYKWDHSSNSTVSSVAGKQVMMIKSSSKMNRSLEDIGRNSEPALVLNADKCHWSMDVSLGNNLTDHWTASSLELSSELKKKLSGNSTPDSTERPTTASSGTITPTTHSPVDLEQDPASSQRHNDSQSHQSSRRHHHHHSHHHYHHHYHHSHHHHHHHHHHHKHKNRHSHSSSTHGKNGAEESTSKTCEESSDNKLFQALSTITKSEKFPSIDEPPRQYEPTHDKGTEAVFEDDVLYCNGDPVDRQSIANKKYSASNDPVDDAKQTIYANIEGTLTHSKNSAFSRHPAVSKSANKEKHTSASHIIVQNDHWTNVSAAPKPSRYMKPFDILSSAMLSFRPIDEMRPRTWSEGCFVRSRKAHDLWRLGNSMKNSPVTDDMISCGVVERICTRFNQFFKDGLCFNTDLSGENPVSEKDSILWQSRRRHYSDDPTLVSSAKSLMTEPTENDRFVTSNVPLITCHGAARTAAQSKSRLECPF